MVDIDGTVAKHGTHRGLYDFSKYYLDKPLLEIWKQIKAISEACGYKIVFLTGRSDDGRKETLEWLVTNLGVPADTPLLMRQAHDFGEDYVVKEKIARESVLPNYNIAGWFEDRLRCVEMARYKLGIQAVYQLNEGQF